MLKRRNEQASIGNRAAACATIVIVAGTIAGGVWTSAALLPNHPTVYQDPINSPRTQVVLQQTENTQDSDSQQQAATAYAQLEQEFAAAVAALRTEIKTKSTKQEQADLLMQKNPVPLFAERFMALAKQHPNTQAAVDSLLFIVGRSKGKAKVAALDQLLEKYASEVKLSQVARSFLTEVPSADHERWFQLIISQANSDQVRSSVILDYAKYVNRIPFFKRTLELSTGFDERLPKAQFEYIMTPRTDSQNEPLIGHLNDVIKNHAELKYKGRLKFGEAAGAALFELQHLQVGMVAPDVEGNDLDGIKFRLSDYRGKVVMLDFWGHWCPPCRAMYAHEQEINRKLADRPFVLLGVNSDGDLETAQEAVSSESLSWRHFWNGPEGTAGPIASQWNIEDWPTIYLIDGNGVIRYRQVLGEDIDRGIETLMAEMGHQVDLRDQVSRQ